MTKAHLQAESTQSSNLFTDIGFTPAEPADLTAKSGLIPAMAKPSSDGNSHRWRPRGPFPAPRNPLL